MGRTTGFTSSSRATGSAVSPGRQTSYPSEPFVKPWLGQTAITEDITSAFLFELLAWSLSVVTPLRLKLIEFADMNMRRSQIEAVRRLHGSLRELTPEQLEIFEKATARKALF